MVKVLGIGNPYRGDDSVGWAVARFIKERSPSRISVDVTDGEATSLIESWKGVRKMILIDAIESGQPAGTVVRLEGEELQAETLRVSTHSFGLEQAIELGRALGRLPNRLVIFGIEGRRFQMGAQMSDEVRDAIPRVVDSVLGELGIKESSDA